MPTYKAPVESVLFLLRDVLGYEHYANLPGFADAPLQTVEAVLGEAARFCENVLQPLNRIGDKEGCIRAADGTVRTPTGFKEAYRLYCEAGWPALSADPAYGGQGLPYTLAAILNEFVSSANMAWGMYPGLTQGAIAALTQHGSEEQKALYLPRLTSGEWSGTMNLTEPQCGTDLGLIRTRAVPAPDGSFQLFGQKIFISAGEHDLTSNIVHLVLARIEGAPQGTKGLSLFVAPKFLPMPMAMPAPRTRSAADPSRRRWASTATRPAS
jgi:alkylation response protein AidB-like acyl-CoA dehydrogenase